MLATLSLLQALEPVALRLRAVPGLACAPGAELERRLACEGRVALFEGPLAEARQLERSLRQLGLTTSINLQPVHPERSA